VFLFKVGLGCGEYGVRVFLISVVAGSRIVCRLGWSLALACRHAEIFEFWLLRLFGVFLV
jgi:hypothetical protein